MQKGYAMILASALCFASYGVWSRLLGHDFGVFFQGWVRSAVILAVLFPILLIKKAIKPIKKEHRKWFVVTMLFTVFTQVPLYYAFNHLPLGTATFLFYASFVIASYLVGWLFLNEKMTGIKIFSLLLSLIGLFVTFGLSLEMFSLLALLLAAFSGLASGGEVATSKKSTRHYSSLQITAYSWVLILATHLPLSWLLGERQIAPSLSVEWLAMFGYAASGLGGFWLVIEGFKHVDASIGSLIGLTEILFAVVFGLLFFGDQITVQVLAGGLIIILAALLPDVYALKHPKAKPIPPPPPL
jgi:drug/metabolite transporter (DMT)-like permease